MLRRWWTKKYQLPPTSDEYLRYTEDELWVEFYEDFYYDNPASEIEALDGAETVQFITGDPELDELEKQIANGEIGEQDVQDILYSWEHGGKKPDRSTTKPPEPPKPPTQDAVEIGEGFDDSYK